MDQEDPRPAVLAISRWDMPTGTESHFPVSSDYVSLFWLPVLGPSSLTLVQRLDRMLDDTLDRFTVSSDDLACSLGLGASASRRSLLNRTLDRCRDFRVLREIFPGVIEVPRSLPALSARQLRRLPQSLQRAAGAHSRIAEYRDFADNRARLRQLRLTLEKMGVDQDEINQQLIRLGYSPQASANGH